MSQNGHAMQARPDPHHHPREDGTCYSLQSRCYCKTQQLPKNQPPNPPLCKVRGATFLASCFLRAPGRPGVQRARRPPQRKGFRRRGGRPSPEGVRHARAGGPLVDNPLTGPTRRPLAYWMPGIFREPWEVVMVVNAMGVFTPGSLRNPPRGRLPRGLRWLQPTASQTRVRWARSGRRCGAAIRGSSMCVCVRTFRTATRKGTATGRAGNVSLPPECGGGTLTCR